MSTALAWTSAPGHRVAPGPFPRAAVPIRHDLAFPVYPVGRHRRVDIGRLTMLLRELLPRTRSRRGGAHRHGARALRLGRR